MGSKRNNINTSPKKILNDLNNKNNKNKNIISSISFSTDANFKKAKNILAEASIVLKKHGLSNNK